LTTIVGDTSTAAATIENVIDQSKNLLNAYGASISASTGAAGSKTWTVTDAEKGAVLSVGMEFYQYLKTSGASAMSVNVSGLGYSSSTSTGGGMGRVQEVAKGLANQLAGRSFLRT